MNTITPHPHAAHARCESCEAKCAKAPQATASDGKQYQS
jgi:hypothetical protein